METKHDECRESTKPTICKVTPQDKEHLTEYVMKWAKQLDDTFLEWR